MARTSVFSILTYDWDNSKGKIVSNIETSRSPIDNLSYYPRDYVDALEAAGCTTHPVGLKTPNAWGLYDMHGNVAEWVSERYGAYPGQPVIDPRREIAKPNDPEEKWADVIRGGSWYTLAVDCRSAARRKVTSSYRDGVIGFRVAMIKRANP